MSKIKNVIYGLVDPRTNQLKYIGFAINPQERYLEHMKPRSRKAHTHKNHWLNQLVEQGLKPEQIILEVLSEASMLPEAEQFWIEYFKSLGCNLTNHGNGGIGSLGRVHTQDTKQKLSEKGKARDWTNWTPGNKKQHLFIDGIENRSCSLCNNYKPITEFTKNKKRGRFNPYCKPCHTNYNKQKALTDERYRYKKVSSERRAEAYRINCAKAGAATANSPEAKMKISEANSKAIIGTNVLTGETIQFDSALKAKEAGFQNSNIGQAIKLNKPYRGFIWQFAKK